MNLKGKIFKTFLLFFLFIIILMCSIKNKSGKNNNGENGDNGNEPPVTCWTASATKKIRPNDSSESGFNVNIQAAKNEYESFQIVLSDTESFIINNISVSDLKKGSKFIDNRYIKVYREVYIDIKTISNTEGEYGLWPDALIPIKDVFFNETRNALPFTASPNINHVFWVDLFIPSGLIAGDYKGSIKVDIDGKKSFNIPINITVWDFELPSTSTLVSAFGFDGWDTLKGHFEHRDSDAQDMLTPLSKLYTECALMNRVSLESAIGEDWSIIPWPITDPIDWTEFDQNWSSFFDGKDLSYGLQNARLTSQRIPLWGDNDNENIIYIRNFVSHFRTKGWNDILFDYTWDEPDGKEDFNGIIRRGKMIREADPNIPLLVTTNIQMGEIFDITEFVDIWTPVINDVNDKEGSICWESEFAGNQRGLYSNQINIGKRLWWYQSCESHGCGIGDSASLCFSGWPSYAIDIPAIDNRIMEWMSFKYDISGELYYSTTYAYMGISGNEDAWNNQYYFWGNGDGTLFYPGRPDKIGGTNHIPIESIRIKMIREGMEDYEYMHLLKILGDESFARAQVDSVISETYKFFRDPDILYKARENMAKRILELK